MKTDITDNYLVIRGWMLTELGLKGSELFVYALIYGFSQDGISTFIGSIDYIQEWIGASSKQTVYNAINKLIERGLIIRREFVQANGAKGVEYYVVMDEDGSPKNGRAVQKMENDSPKNGRRVSKKWTDPVQKMESYNKDSINNKYNNTIVDNQSINPSCTEEGAADGLMDRIRTQIEYDVLTSGDEFSADDADAVVIIMAEVETSTRPTIRIGAEDKPREVVRSVFQQLKCDDVMNALKAMHDYSDYNEIYDPKALLRTYLYNAKFNSVGDFCRGSYEFNNRRLEKRNE